MPTLFERVQAFFKGLPLRTALIVPFVVQIFVIITLTSYISFLSGRQAVNDLAEQLTVNVTQRIELRVRDYLETPHLFHELNTAAAENGNLDLDNYAELEQYFWRQVQLSDSVSSVYYGDAEGNFVGVQERAGGETVSWLRDQAIDDARKTYLLDERGNRLDEIDSLEYDPRARPWYKVVVEREGPAWSEIYRFASLDYAVLGITPAVPIHDSTGTLQGVIAIDLPLAQLSDFLRQLDISSDGHAFILERSGDIVASSVEEEPFISTEEGFERLQGVDSREPLIHFATRHLLAEFGSLEQVESDWKDNFSINGEQHFIQTTDLIDDRGLGWLIVVVIPEADLMGSLNESSRNAVVIMIIAVLVATFIGLGTYQWIVRPLMRLNTSAKAFADGHWSERVRIGRRNELGELGDSFNQMADQLQESFTTLEARNKFFAIVAHDLRAPFHPLLNYSELLAEIAHEAEPDEIQHMSTNIHHSAETIYNLLENLLQWSRLQQGRMPYLPITLNLHLIAMQNVDLVSPQATEKQIKLQNLVPADTTVHADESMVNTILRNLLSNGLKFTNTEGEITISAKSTAEFVEVAVTDTGVGLNEEDVDKLFRIDIHHSTNGTANERGTGLGLILCRDMIKQHGGDIWVESQVDVGTTFHFSLPHPPITTKGT